MISEGVARFAELELQIIALSWLVVLYIIKIYQLARLPMPWEKGPIRGNAISGILRTYSNIFIPWSMESSKKHFWRWVAFGTYHVGAGIAILTTFTSSFAAGMLAQTVR